MQITEIDTLGAMREILNSPENRQLPLCRERVMEPLRPVWQNMLHCLPDGAGADPALTAARMMKLYLPKMGHQQGLAALVTLERGRVQQDYLARTGRTPAQATYHPWRVIAAESGWFTV